MTADANECDDKGTGMLQSPVVRVGLLLIVSAFFVRGAVCWRSLDQYTADPDAYRAIAETLGVTGVFGLTAASGEIVATAFRPPLYPYVLSLCLVDQQLPNTAVAFVHTLLGVLAVLFTYLAGLSMLPRNAGVWGSGLAAFLVLIDPLLLRQSTIVMTETFATTLVCIILWWWTAGRDRRHKVTFSLVLGGLLGLAFLIRPTFIVWAMLLILGSCVIEIFGFTRGASRLVRDTSLTRRQQLLPVMLSSFVALVVLLVVVGGWALRNARSVGHPVWATTHGGYTLLLGNNPFFYDYLRSGSADGKWDSASFQVAYSHRYDGDPRTEKFWRHSWDGPRQIQDPAVVRVVTEHSDDRLAYESAKAVISRQPSMFLWSAVVRVFRLWSPFPHSAEGRTSWLLTIVGIYNCGLYVAMVIGCFRLGRTLFMPRWLPVLALFLTLSAVHACYWSNIRMRAPAVPAMALLAACALPLKRVEIQASGIAEREPVCG